MSRGPQFLLLPFALACLACASGCHLVVPDVSYQPLLHNPFPQLSKVAVAPFFNQSDEPTVDGRQFAMAYFAELQGTRGFEVAPVGVVEEAIIQHAVDLSRPGEARRLAQILGVDALVVGSVTDYSPYYPPRCGMRVEWYAANPGYHAIPAGYGLPWGTPEEEYIPEELVFEAEMELARAQMATQSPDCLAGCSPLAPPPALAPPHQATPIPTDLPQVDPFERPPATPPTAERPTNQPPLAPQQDPDQAAGEQQQAAPAAEALPPPADGSALNGSEADDAAAGDSFASRGGAADGTGRGKVRLQKFDAPLDSDAGAVSPDSLTTDPSGAIPGMGVSGLLPADWPDARGFRPAGPCATRPACVPTLGPVITHTQIYRGHDPDFTAALASYVGFRDDARFGGWQSYLERSDDFIRFCAHLHLAELLTARGGGGETRVARRWSVSR